MGDLPAEAQLYLNTTVQHSNSLRDQPLKKVGQLLWMMNDSAWAQPLHWSLALGEQEELRIGHLTLFSCQKTATVWECSNQAWGLQHTFVSIHFSVF